MKAFIAAALALLLAGCNPGTVGASADNGTQNVGEGEIRAEIAAAQMCNTKEDCVTVASVCPFGCHITVNKMYEEKIRNLVESYPTNCMYSCVQQQGVDCVDSLCQPVIAGETP